LLCAIVLAGAAFALPLAAGCTRISVDPDCPTNLEVGDTVDLSANATNEGGIPTFEWTVIPESAGEFDNPDRQDTDFVGREAGPATIRLFASDGLFTSTAQCPVQIGAGGLIVELTFSPEEPRTGDEVMLTCESLGGVAAEELTIQQEEGPEVTLTPGAEGEASFTPAEAGAYTFSCTGTAGDETSAPSTVSITVRSTRPPR
jgi:hypothetical protein